MKIKKELLNEWFIFALYETNALYWGAQAPTPGTFLCCAYVYYTGDRLVRESFIDNKGQRKVQESITCSAGLVKETIRE